MLRRRTLLKTDSAGLESGVRHMSMRLRIALVAAALTLASSVAAAQGRGAQAVTGAGLASLGVYGAFADRDCDLQSHTTLRDGRCEWRNSLGRLVRDPPDLPAGQVAGGLAVAGIGGLMAGGVWAPSKTVDTILAAGAGTILLFVAFDNEWLPGTVHVESGGRRHSTCFAGDMSWGGDDLVNEHCMKTSFSRLHALWAGVASLGLAAGRWLWREGPGPALSVDVRPGGLRVSKTIEF